MTNKKRIITFGITLALTAAMSLTAFAYGWQPADDGRWWYGTNDDDSTWYAGEWQWIDGNCYYFYDDGYMAADTTVDGYTVNADGVWVWDDQTLPEEDMITETVISEDFPVFEGLYRDIIHNNYFLLYTDADGSVHIDLTDESGNSPRRFYDLTYEGDGRYYIEDLDATAYIDSRGALDMSLGSMRRNLAKVN